MAVYVQCLRTGKKREGLHGPGGGEINTDTLPSKSRHPQSRSISVKMQLTPSPRSYSLLTLGRDLAGSKMCPTSTSAKPVSRWSNSSRSSFGSVRKIQVSRRDVQQWGTITAFLPDSRQGTPVLRHPKLLSGEARLKRERRFVRPRQPWA